jgi:hypothetical protein
MMDNAEANGRDSGADHEGGLSSELVVPLQPVPHSAPRMIDR